MLDQAFKLREMFRSAALPAASEPVGPPMIVLSSGRVGAGATTIAINLAAVLSDRGERVVLVDAAQRHPNIIQAAGIGPQIEHDVDDVASGLCPAVDALVPGPAGTLILAARGGSRLTRSDGRQAKVDSSPLNQPKYSRDDQQRLLRELQSLSRVASLVVVDAGSGLTPLARRFWLRSSLVLLLTTLEDVALVDAYAVVKHAVRDKLRANVRLIVNQCENDKLAADACRRFAAACQRFLARAVPALPAVPRHATEHAHGLVVPHGVPRVWESPDSPFGHAMLWLGRAAADALPLADQAGRRLPVVHEHAPEGCSRC